MWPTQRRPPNAHQNILPQALGYFHHIASAEGRDNLILVGLQILANGLGLHVDRRMSAADRNGECCTAVVVVVGDKKKKLCLLIRDGKSTCM